jgi:phosphoesterase RecJ-like protein
MIDLAPWLAGVPAPTMDRLGAARRVLAVGHENPDADTIGASLAVARIVEAQGGVATLVCNDPVPDLYDFIPGADAFRTEPDPESQYDLLVISDCGGLDRIGPVYGRFQPLFDALPRVVLDHHASTRDVGAADWVEPDAAATCEMVALLGLRLGVDLGGATGGLATALMAGIVMDTAVFAHPNTTSRTLAVAAALLEAGAPLAEIARRLYRTKPTAQLRLFGRILGRLETAAGGRVVHSTVLTEDFLVTATAPEHAEGLIDLLSQAAEAEVVLLFKEAGPSTRVSVRTRRGGVDATVLTGRFGGGGHARAAGATLEAPLASARDQVLAEAVRLIGGSGR